MDWERKREEEKEQTEERGKVWDFWREKLYLLSKFPTVILTVRASRQDQYWGVSTNSIKVGVFLLLALLFV